MTDTTGREEPDALTPYTPEHDRGLAIVERAHRGALETQFADALYCAFLFHRALGGLDVLLRGAAVTYAGRAAVTPVLRLGNREIGTLTDARSGLQALLDAGSRIWVEEPDLSEHGLSGDGLLTPGVQSVPAGVIAARWPDYRAVFYL